MEDMDFKGSQMWQFEELYWFNLLTPETVDVSENIYKIFIQVFKIDLLNMYSLKCPKNSHGPR